MREKHLLLLILLLLIFTVDCQLSCHRIPTSFCCTSRIRDQCPEQCAMVQCGNEFIHSLFSTDGSRKPTSGSSTGAHDGNANIGGIGSVDTRGDQTTVIEKPDEPVPWGFNSGDAAPPTSTLPTVTSGFPTLIPFSPDSWSTVTQSPLAPLPMVTSRIPIPESSSSSPIPLTPRRDAHRRRTTPDPRIIRPPESLVVIGDYDEDEPPSENAVVDSPQPFQTPPPPPPSPPVISNSGDVFARSRKEISATPDQQSGTAAATLRDSSSVFSSPSLINHHLRRFSSRSSAPFLSRAHHRLICRLTTPGRLLCNRPSKPRPHRYVTPPKYWKSDVRKMAAHRKKNFATTRIHITPFMGELARRRRKLDSGSSHEWKVSILPRGQNTKPAVVNSIPPFMIDGKSDERFNKFYRTIDRVINKLDLTGDLREGEPQIRLEGSTKDLSVESSAVVVVPRTTVAPGVTNKVSVIPFRPLHFTAPPVKPSGEGGRGGPPGVSPPALQLGECGVAPEFKPCVSNLVASRSLLECCKRKNLPIGCQQLCRYDITQAEIRSAMDRGQCGIFNVAPFLECASQGKDNSECCRHRGIVQKTGPQCEQFCRPSQGLTSLGVQHIVCGNAVGDMLHCHHSGVRD